MTTAIHGSRVMARIWFDVYGTEYGTGCNGCPHPDCYADCFMGIIADRDHKLLGNPDAIYPLTEEEEKALEKRLADAAANWKALAIKGMTDEEVAYINMAGEYDPFS